MTHDQLIAGLRKAASDWRSALKRVGNHLIQLENEGFPLDKAYREILKKDYNMPRATFDVALEWARGTYGDDLQTQKLVSRIQHSVLRQFTPEVAEAVAYGKHRIETVEGRIADKTLDEMLPVEIANNIGPQGFIPIHERVKKSVAFRSCRAKSVRVGDDGQVYLVAKTGGSFLHMQVNHELLVEALEKLGQSVEQI